MFDAWIGLMDSDGDGQFNWISDSAPLDPDTTQWVPTHPTPGVRAFLLSFRVLFPSLFLAYNFLGGKYLIHILQLLSVF